MTAAWLRLPRLARGVELLRQVGRWLQQPRRSSAEARSHAGDRTVPGLHPTVPGLHPEPVHLLARCDGCGLCDAGCALAGRLPLGEPGPSFLVLQASRGQRRHSPASHALQAYVACAGCAACAAWCPQEVPLALLTAWAARVAGHADHADHLDG